MPGGTHLACLRSLCSPKESTVRACPLPIESREEPIMDFILQAFGYVFVYVFIKPFFFVCQAVAGILLPTQTPRLLRAKKRAALLLLLGVVAVSASFVMPYLGLDQWTCWFTFLVGFTSLAIASAIGHHIEKEVAGETCELDATDEPGSTDDFAE